MCIIDDKNTLISLAIHAQSVASAVPPVTTNKKLSTETKTVLLSKITNPEFNLNKPSNLLRTLKTNKNEQTLKEHTPKSQVARKVIANTQSD